MYTYVQCGRRLSGKCDRFLFLFPISIFHTVQIFSLPLALPQLHLSFVGLILILIRILQLVPGSSRAERRKEKVRKINLSNPRECFLFGFGFVVGGSSSG
jgi:hypothetical protein